jgi:hypothetical protein
MRAPTGSIVRTIRVSERETLNGAEVVRTISGAGVIIRLKSAVPGMKPAEIRRAFTRAASQLGVILDAVEFNHGHYSQSGKEIAVPSASAFQAVGEVGALEELVGHFAVDEWHYALNVKPPRGAQGSGPEKVRPTSGSVFGKPQTVKATGEALAKNISARVRTVLAS